MPRRVRCVQARNWWGTTSSVTPVSVYSFVDFCGATINFWTDSSDSLYVFPFLSFHNISKTGHVIHIWWRCVLKPEKNVGGGCEVLYVNDDVQKTRARFENQLLHQNRHHPHTLLGNACNNPTGSSCCAEQIMPDFNNKYIVVVLLHLVVGRKKKERDWGLIPTITDAFV